MSKYLVTGGEGFIGRNLINRLESMGNEVVSLDIEGNPDFKGSICDREIVKTACKGVDGVFHLGAITSPPQFEEDLFQGFDTNVIGTLNVLKAASDANVRRVLIASSSSTYGDLTRMATEDDLSYSHRNMYPLTKVFGELLGKYFTNRNEAEVVSVRYFNTYGKDENTKSAYASVVWRFVKAAMKNEDIVIYGDGTQSRDFIYVKDTVDASISVFDKGNAGQSYNIGSGKSYTFNEIARLVSDVTETNSSIVHAVNPLKNYQKFTLANLTKITKEVGWVPSYGLRDGIVELMGGQ